MTTTIGQTGSLPRPSSISTTGATPGFQTGTYGYDGVGNIIAMGSDAFLYDSRSRLAAAYLNGVTGPNCQGFSYDPRGNLLSRGAGSWNPSPASCSVGTTTTFCSGSCGNNQVSGASYVRGNLTSYSGQTFSWDGLDRMASSTQGSLTWSYLYDGSDERVAKIPPSGAWAFTLRDESKRVVTEYAGSTTSRDKVFLGNQVVASYANLSVGGNDTAWSFSSSDHLGTPRLTTDVTGAGVARQYWPFGDAVTTREVPRFSASPRWSSTPRAAPAPSPRTGITTTPGATSEVWAGS